MGNNTMALAMLDNALFPAFGRLARPSLFSRSNDLFADMSTRREAFLREMDADLPEGTQSYSYSSSTFRIGDSEPVTHKTEEWRTNDEHVSRSHRAIGDKVVEEVIKNGETNRTLHNLNESELQDFDQQIASKQANFGSFAPTQKPMLPALEADLKRLQ